MKDKIKEMQKKYKVTVEEVKNGDSIHEQFSENEKGILSFFRETESLQLDEYNDSGNLHIEIDSSEICSIGEIIEAQIEYLKARNEAINQNYLETDSNTFNFTCNQCIRQSCLIL